MQRPILCAVLICWLAGSSKLLGQPATRPTSNPVQFAYLNWLEGMPYEQARQQIDPGSLPALYEALKNPVHQARWSNISLLIGYVGNDEASARAILEYVQRPEDWNMVPEQRRRSQAVRKTQGICWAGKMGDKATTAILIQSMTFQGAREVLKQWIDGPLPSGVSATELIRSVRGYSAVGLTMGQDPEGLKAVEREYNAIHAAIRQENPNSELHQLHAHFVDAMAIRDAIAELGKEGYLKVEGHNKLQFLSKHIAKYR